MFSFNWPIIITTTVILYALTILFLPFNTVAATIMLFSLIAYWSRLPAVCIYEPLPIMYVMDFIDVFAVIIAIYIGPLEGAAFAFIWNVYPRLSGGYGMWEVFIKDGGVQALICLFIPLIHMVTGNLVLTVLMFSIIRIPVYLILCFFIPHRPFVQQLIRVGAAGTAVIFINSIYAKLFGDFFTSLLEKGASFSWVLFFVATAIILIFSIAVMGFSPAKAGKNIGKKVVKIAKARKKKEKTKGNDENLDELRRIRDSL